MGRRRGGEGSREEGIGGEGRGEVGRRGERREGARDKPAVTEGSLQYALYVKYIRTYVKELTTIYYSWLQPTCVNALNSTQ